VKHQIREPPQWRLLGGGCSRHPVCMDARGIGEEVVGDVRRRRCGWGRWRWRIPGVDLGIVGAISGPRWLILRIIGDKEKATSDIYDELARVYGIAIPRTVLYYHLSELERLGVIEVAGYRETGKGGAPEKVWRLRIARIIIDIVSGEIRIEHMKHQK